MRIRHRTRRPSWHFYIFALLAYSLMFLLGFVLINLTHVDGYIGFWRAWLWRSPAIFATGTLIIGYVLHRRSAIPISIYVAGMALWACFGFYVFGWLSATF